MAACALFGVTATTWAQSWTGNEPAEGTFLLYNVGAEKFINNGDPNEDWGTNAYLQSNFGLDFEFEADGDAFKLNTNVSNGGNNHYLATSTWCDGGPTSWTFTPVSGENLTYTISNGDSYLTSNNDLNDLVCGGNTNDSKSYWKLVSLDDFKTVMRAKEYATSNPMDVSVFIKGRSFVRNDGRNSSWTKSNVGGNFVWVGSANKGDNPHYFGNEAWNNTFNVQQVIENLPNGTYEVQCSGFGTNGTAYVFGNSASGALQTDNTTTHGTNKEAKWKAIHEDNAFAGQSSGPFIVGDGKITLGIKRENNVNQDWCVYDEFRLFYYGPLDLSTYKQALEDAIAAAEAINQSDKMSNKALSDLQKAIQDYKGQTYTSDTDYQTAIDAVNDAIKGAETSIKSYKIIAAGSIPDNSLDGWVCENTNTFHINTWSVEGNSDGSEMKTPFIENWVGKGSYLGAGRVYYKLEGLNPGEDFYAQALVRSYNEADKDAPNGPNFFINDNEVDLTEAGTTFVFKNDNNEMSGIYATLGGQATIGDDGTLTLGVTIADNCNYNWVAFKSVFIQSMTDALAKAIKDAEALEGKIPDAAYSDLSSIVSSHNNATVDDIKAINDATKKYSAFVVPYVAFKNLKDNADQVAAAGTDDETGRNTLLSVISTQNNKVIAEKESADVITTATATLKEELTTYVTNANPVGEGEKFNMTFMLTNPDLTGLPTWQKADGWYTDQKSGNSQVMTNGNATSQDGTKTAFFEYWSNPPMGNNLFALYQKVNLPKGTYNMSCYAFAQYEQEGKHENRPNGVYFYANDVQGSAVNNARLSEQSIAFVTGKAQEVKIGLKPVGGNGNTWMGIGYVQLFKVPINKIDLDEDMAYEPENVAGDVTLKKRVYSGWNTIVLPFGMPEDIFTEQFGGGQLYKYTGDKNGVLQFAEATAIEPHIPYLFNSYAGDGSRKTIFLEAVTVSTGTPITAGTNFDFVGTYAPINRAITESDYLLVPGKFQKGNGRNSLNAYRAYIRGKVESEARELLISIDGVTTAIEAVDGKSVDSNSPIYNLAGQRVKSAQKGLYIQGGKKFVK